MGIILISLRREEAEAAFVFVFPYTLDKALIFLGMEVTPCRGTKDGAVILQYNTIERR
jgi:hypothetical protein